MDRNIAGKSKSGQSESLSIHDDSFVPNGCVRCHPLHEELADDCDAERVGVLDYMPLSRHATMDASQKSVPVALHRLRTDDRNLSLAESFDSITPCPDEPKNIELTTFRITECRDRRNLVPCSSCASDDDELLGAEADDYLHEVVVQSSDDIPGDGPERSDQAISGFARASLGDREMSSLLRCIPSSFGATRDGAWSRPDTGCESPSVDNGESVSHELEEDTFTTFRVSSYESGCVATTTMDKRDDEALGDRSQHHESSTVVVEDEKHPEVQLGSNSLPPVEVVSVDRSAMDPSSISRSNVLYLNDYSLWTNAARAFCRDESSSDRSEVEKRQERRDKRRERRGHERTVKAEEIEGYMGMKEVMDLVEYIQGEVEKSKDGVLQLGKKEVVKTSKRVKESETSVMPAQGEPAKSSEMPQKKPTQKQKATSKTSQKTTPLNVPETTDVDLEQGKDASVGTVTVSIEMSRSEENAENDSMLEQPYEKESSTSVEMSGQTELDPSENPSSTSKDLGRTSTRSNSPEPEESMWQATQLAAKFHSATVNNPTQKSPSKPDKPEQMLGHGSKNSKKPNNKRNRNAQVADKTRRVSLAKSETMSMTSQSLSNPHPSQEDAESFVRTSHGGMLAVDCTTAKLSESELSADATVKDMSHVNRYPYKSSSAQDHIQDQDDEWTVHTRRHPKSRTKLGDAEKQTSSQGEQDAIVWKDQSSKPPPSYRKPEGRAPFGRAGSISDGYQGQKFPHLSGSRGRQGSTSSLNLETSSSAGKVGSRTFWGSRESKDNSKMSDMPRKFPNQRSCVDDIQSRKEESVTYARITAGDPVWPQCQSVKLVGVEEATPGQTSSNPVGASEVPSQIVDEADLPRERMPDEPSTNVNLEPDGAGTGDDLLSKASAETGGKDLVSTPKEQPSSDATLVSVTMKQVRSDTTLSKGLASSPKELSRSAGNVLSDSKQDDHSKVTDRRLSDISTSKVSIDVAEPETKENQSTADVTETKPDVVSISKDAATLRQHLPKTQSPVSQQKRNPEPKTKTLPVEFSKRFKDAKVDGISFCFDPTVTDSKSQGLSSFSDRTPTLESSNNSGGTISNRLVSGPTYSTTMVPAGGGLQSQGSGTSVTNCSRPIAPLSGPGHTSGAKTPVVVVNPMQLARGHTEPSQTIVGNDIDPEILKEVMVPMDTVRIDDTVAPMLAKIVTTVSSPVFPSKANDFTGALLTGSTRLPASNNIPTQPQQLNESPVTMSTTGANGGSGLALAKCVTFVEEPQLETGSESRTEMLGPPSTHQLQQSDTRPKHLEPVSLHPSRDVQLDAPQQQFVPPWSYMLCRPYVMCPQLPQAVPSVYHQGMVPPVGLRQDAALALPKVPKQPRFRQEQHAVRVAVPVPSLVLIQNYIYNEFQKVLEEEKHGEKEILLCETLFVLGFCGKFRSWSSV